LGLPSTPDSDFSLPSAGPGATGDGTPSAQPAQAAPSTGSGANGPVLQAAPASSNSTRSGWARLRGPLFAALALAAAGLWFVAGSQERPLAFEPDEGGAST